MSAQKNKSIFKNALYKILLSVFNIVIPLIIGPYVSRVFGPKLIGRLNYTESVYQYFLIFAAFGIYQYGLREVSRIRQDEKKLASLFSSLFVIGLITNVLATSIYVLVIFFGFHKEEAYPVMMIYTFNLFFNIFYVEWINEALENYNFITIKTIITRSIYVVVLLTQITKPEQFNNYVILVITITFLNNILSFIYIKRRIKFDFKHIRIRPHIKYLLMGIVIANANILYTNLDKFVLGKFVDETQVGLYSNPQNVMYMIITVMSSVMYVTVPRLSNCLGNEDDKNYLKLLKVVTRSYFVFLFPAAIGLIALSDEVVLLFGGAKFASANNVMKVFAVYMIITGIENILNNQVIYVRRKEREVIPMLLGCGAINLVCDIVLLKFNVLNAFTAILSTTIVCFVLLIIEYVYIRRVLNLNFNIFSANMLQYLYISLIFIPITYVIKLFVSHFIVRIVVAMVICASIYFIVLYIIKDKIFLMILDKLLKKVKKA